MLLLLGTPDLNFIHGDYITTTFHCDNYSIGSGSRPPAFAQWAGFARQVATILYSLVPRLPSRKKLGSLGTRLALLHIYAIEVHTATAKSPTPQKN